MQGCGARAVIVVLVFVALPLAAQDTAGPGLDLLLLVDRSGSMSAFTPAAVVDALPLALNALAWSARSARIKHRFGIVSFGSHARLDPPLTVADDNHLPSLRARIGDLDSRSLGNTNFAEAFELAIFAFDALPADARRRRAIVLLSDGRANGSLEPLKKLVVENLAKRQVSIDVILMGDHVVPEPWRRLAPGRIHQVRGDRGDLLASLHRIITALAGTRAAQQDLGRSRSLVLPPYLDVVVFDIIHSRDNHGITIVPPGALQPLDGGSPGVEEMRVGDVLSTVVIQRPAAGTWTFESGDASARVRVLSQQFFPRGELVVPDATVRQHESTDIAYRFDDGRGRPLQEIPQYPLSVDVAVVFPDGRRFVRPMSRHEISMFRTLTPTQCETSGRYWTEVYVTTADSIGKPVRIYEDRWSGFGVEAEAESRTPAIQSRLVTPPAERSRRPWWIVAVFALCASGLAVAMWRR